MHSQEEKSGQQLQGDASEERRSEFTEHKAVSEVKQQPRKPTFQATFLSHAKWGPGRWPKATQHRIAAAMLVPILLERRTEAYGKSP